MTLLTRSVLVLAAAIFINLTFSYLSPQLRHLLFVSDSLSTNQTMSNKVILYGSPISTCTRRVAVVLKEKGIPYELKALNFAEREHKSEDYLASKQPFGQVPVLQDGDVQLFESRAIARYIALKYATQGTPLVPSPSNFAEWGKFEEAASVEQNNFDPFASGMAMEKIFLPMNGLEGDAKRADSLAETLKQKLQGYERILSKRKFLAGDSLSLADLFHLPYGALANEKLGFEALTSGEFPNVARWWKEISSLPSWQAVKDGA